MNLLSQKPMSSQLGLYLHIPFCSNICHYCDFNKTARFDPSTTHAYWQALRTHTDHWLKLLDSEADTTVCFPTVFFGGGTPGLFQEEFVELLDHLRSRFADGVEISIEANPQNITPKALCTWADAGINRLSIGVQTFSPQGLAFLQRDHDGDKAREALQQAQHVFTNVNADLIYGWPGQNLETWRQDLQTMIALGIPHLSLYSLTYEERTPIGRRAARGVLQPQEDQDLEAYYTVACELLSAAGYEHDEVSNWSKPGFHCRHNFIYWQGEPYLGVGSGAHSFFASSQNVGFRHAYGPSLKAFVHELPKLGPSLQTTWREHKVPGCDQTRDGEAWLLEYIGCGLRCRSGIDLERISAVQNREFMPRPAVAQAFAEGLIKQQKNRLFLEPREWFRETAWSIEVAMSFR